MKLRSCPKENHIADEKLFEAAGFSGCELSDDSVPDEAEDDVNEEDDAVEDELDDDEITPLSDDTSDMSDGESSDLIPDVVSELSPITVFEDVADTASELAEAVTGTISGFELCTGRSLFITKADTNTDAEYIKDIDIAIIMTAA